MVNRLGLFAWLVSLESLDAAPERSVVLRDGGELTALALREGIADGDAQEHDRIAQLLAELESDKWIAWDWTRYGSDPRPEQPPAAIFDHKAIQRVKNIRITPEGYAAFAARQALGGPAEPRGDQPPGTDSAGNVTHQYDMFICHASEDKAAVARPLANALQARGFAVWFDEEQIEVGASLRTTIEAGLAASRYGVVVLSHAFFDKQWPQNELDGLFARETTDGDAVILPLWHEIDHAFLVSKSPIIASRFALDTNAGIPEVAERLARRLRRERGEGDLRARAAEPPPRPAPSTGPNTPSHTQDMTAVQARQHTIAMLRASDDVGLRELLRFERSVFESSVLSTLRDASESLGSSKDPELMQPAERALWNQVDRRLGSLLPVMQYRPGALNDELAALLALAGTPTPTRSPYAAWLDGPRWPVWLVTLILGTAAVAFEQFDLVIAMWRQHAPYDNQRPMPVARLGGAAELGAALTRARPSQVARAHEIWYPAFAVWDSDLLTTHYPEIMRGGDTPDAALGFLSRCGDFLWLCGGLAGRDQVNIIRFWSSSQVHPTLRARLNDDPRLAERLAAALDLDPNALLATLDDWIRTAPVWPI